MLFTSGAFFIFLPIVLALYFSLERRAQNGMLLVASYFFYGWWDWRFCSLLAISTFLDFFCSLGMERHPARRRVFLLASLAGNLGILGFFKYANFFVDSAAALLAALGFQAHLPTLKIILPVGISFYTFQTMAYTIDVYRGQIRATRSLLDFALYVCYFPQLVAGPIERAQNLLGQFAAPRRVTRRMLASGALLVLLGFFRKIAIADAAAPYVEWCFAEPAQRTWIELLAGVWLFAIQIYGDFCGYSDIARGISRIMGIELMENFNQPYLSASITEFWRRWHISLSTWLRDYLYIPLGGNRGGTRKTYRNLMLTMLLGGLWHGANWTFVVWGGLHGLYLAAHKFWLGLRGRARPAAPAPLGKRLAGMVFTFHLVLLTWVFFRARDFGTAWSYLAGILGGRGGWAAFHLGPVFRVAFFSTLMLFVDLPQYRARAHERLLQWPWIARGLAYAALAAAILFLRPLNETPFIYFQF
ncbi:MAG: MBOAT family protein [Kiritimatiellae bacterium]|nr:MBOAT family protein [Kiritimatiellia bacterium]